MTASAALDTAVDPWVVVLDRLAADLADAESALERGELPVLPRFDAPAVLPPLPEVHVARAVSIAERQREVEEVVADRLAGIGRELGSRPNGAGPKAAVAAPRRTARFETHA